MFWLEKRVTPVNIQKRKNDVIHKLWSQRLDAIKNIRTIIKMDVASVEIFENHVLLHLTDGRNIYWNTASFMSAAAVVKDGTVEKEETVALMKIVRSSNVVFDIGANFGWYTTLFSKLVGELGEVHSFEPTPLAFDELKINVEVNRLNNAMINCMALGDRKGEEKIYYPVHYGTSMASLLPNPERGEHWEYNCKLSTLDEYVKEHDIKKVDLIKLDVEGAERNVIIGAKRTIDTHKPIIMLEVCQIHINLFGYTPHDLFEMLGCYNYRFFISITNKFVEVDSFEGLPVENIFCLTDDHFRKLDKVIEFNLGRD